MPRRMLYIALIAVCGLAVACGEEGIQIPEDDALYGAAVIFQQRCSGCHTFEAAGAQGSAVKANSSERRDGPSFDERSEDYESVLYAIRNGGFSSGPMPQNIVVGKEAEQVACFVATYSGGKGATKDTGGQEEGPSGGSTSGEACPAD